MPKKSDYKGHQNFPITGVTRMDLKEIGFDTDIDDETMVELAGKMADAYCDTGFWIDLPIIAERLGIKKLQ